MHEVPCIGLRKICWCLPSSEFLPSSGLKLTDSDIANTQIVEIVRMLERMKTAEMNAYSVIVEYHDSRLGAGTVKSDVDAAAAASAMNSLAVDELVGAERNKTYWQFITNVMQAIRATLPVFGQARSLLILFGLLLFLSFFWSRRPNLSGTCCRTCYCW